MFFWPVLRLGIIGGLALAAAGAAGCGDEEAAGGDGAVRAVTTLGLFADFVERVGGGRVDVVSLMPAGADPHTWEPSPGDVETVAGADIAFANGLHLDEGAVDVLETNLPDGAPLVLLAESAVREGAVLREGAGHADEGEAEEEESEHEESEEGEGGEEGDPHLWMDPANALLYASIIRDELAALDPEGASAYQENFESYANEIESAREYASAKVQEVPEDRRKLVTTHDAFGYFAGAFGLEVVAVVAPGPGQEASPRDIARIAGALESEGVPAVFVEPQVGEERRILEQAAADAGVAICTLYSDSLDDRVSNYVELLRFNADEVARCLGEGAD
jgi:ABC-type Zn uptake system ZnuABC Zn-binding protein ZnuA